MSFERIRFELYNAQQAHRQLGIIWRTIKPWLLSGCRLHIEVRAMTRTLAQNRLMWSCLRDLSKQVKWDSRTLSDESWKHYLSAHLDGQDMVPNMDGTGFVVLSKGKSTSEMTIAEMTALIELAHAFGTSRDVKWSRTSLGRDVPDEVFEPEGIEA